MDIALEADIYCPIINEEFNYVDKIPSNIIHGLRCPCGARKDKVYVTYGMFNSHIKSKHHQEWLTELNMNKINFYKENEELKKTIQNQQKIISQMKKDSVNNLQTINFLTQQLINHENKSVNMVNNLLDLDL
jgi:hypothetical protein